MQGLVVRVHNIHPIERLKKQVAEMNGDLRVYKPICQLAKLVPRAHITGRVSVDDAGEKAVASIEATCSKSKATKQLPPLRKSQYCGVGVRGVLRCGV